MEAILKMDHNLIQIIFMIVLSSQTLGFPLGCETNIFDLPYRQCAGRDHLSRRNLVPSPHSTESVNFGDIQNGNSSLCYYKGRSHNDGDVIDVDKPCLLCRCKKGALTCSLRICTDIPDPPPSGCYIVHNADQCCPQIICPETENKESDIEVRTVSGPTRTDVCMVNGSLYAEGSALGSSNLCEYCYCIGGQQKCIKPKCSVPFDGCSPIYSSNSCCPTSYDCRDRTTNVSVLQEKNLGCKIEDVVYAEGEMLSANSSDCENCYCMKGKVSCVPVICETQFDGECEPVYKPGQCCPTSYICYSEGRTGTTALDAVNTTEPMPTTLSLEEALESATFVTEMDDNPKSRIDDIGGFTEIGYQKKETTPEVTTSEPEASTLPYIASLYPVATKNDLTDIASRNRVSFLTDNKTTIKEEQSSISPLLEEIYSSSTQSYDEYDSYDYNEPRLPPSLPNLIIFPFVAADAVVKDEEIPKTVSYDESNVKRVGTETAFYKDYFSPPTKTEGGFIPKEPPIFGSNYPENQEDSLLLGQRPDWLVPSITNPPKKNSEQCILKGRLYEHGELLSEPGDCQSCVCYYGDVICQEIICPPVGKGCFRSMDKDDKSCCKKVICDTKAPDELTTHDYTNALERTTPKPVKPAVVDVIQVTPNPSTDATRANPVPSLLDELLTVYGDQQTKKPITVTYKNLIVDYYPDFLVTTTRDDLRKKNYKNPVFYTTEIYPFTEKPQTSENVTFPTQQTVTSSISTSDDDLEGNNSNYPYYKKDLIRTSIRPIITVATEPSKLFEYYTVEEYKPTPKQQLRGSHQSNRPRPQKKTTETSFGKDERYNTPTIKSTVKQKHSTKTKSKNPTTVQTKETQTKSTTEKNSFEDTFSLDSVWRFFFDTETTYVPPVTTRKTTKKDGVKKFTASPPEERSRQTTRETTPSTKYKDFDAKAQAVEDEKKHSSESTKKNALGSLLKLAGCNIYGRMYRVGKIITELSNPCLECICTDFGVECNPLTC